MKYVYFCIKSCYKIFFFKFYNFFVFFFSVCWYDLKRRCLKQLYRAGQRKKKSSKKICFSQYGRNKRQTFGIVKYNHRKASRINSALLARAKRGSSITGQLDNSSIRLFCSLTLVSVTYRYVMQPILCDGYTFYLYVILRRYINFKNKYFLQKEIIVAQLQSILYYNSFLQNFAEEEHLFKIYLENINFELLFVQKS